MEANGTLPLALNNLLLDFLAQELLVSKNRSLSPATNSTEWDNSLDVNTDVYSKVLVTVIYIVLFVVGCLGNSITLYTLLRKKSLQNLQSTVHYHLVSLAVSDLLILVISMPIELYNFIWVHHPWAFGAAVCKGYYFLRDGCSYATALNIASLSMERYMAICHPFKAKSIMSRSRTKKLIGGIWVASFLLATPMLIAMGQRCVKEEMICTTIVSTFTAKTVLQVNALLSFALPMALISVLNGAIARQLQQMFRQAGRDRHVCVIGGNATIMNAAVETSRVQSLRHGVRVLRVVVLAFVVCWLPYHCRRLMYCYVSEWTNKLFDFYHYLYMVTNVLYYVSSAVNPVLYNLVSAHYRQIFFSTLQWFCLPCRKRRSGPPDRRRAQSRQSNSVSSNHTIFSNVVKETAY